MNGHLHSLVFIERGVLAGHLPWMGWNLLLAAIPLLLAWVLFRPARRREALFGWAGLNRVWTPVLVPAPFRHVPDPELSSASPRRRTYTSSRDATGAVVSWRADFDRVVAFVARPEHTHTSASVISFPVMGLVPIPVTRNRE